MQFYNTDDLPVDLAKKSFAANYARIHPNGEAPLFALSGMAKKTTALQIEHGYWSKTAVFSNMITVGTHDAVVTTLNVVSTSGVVPNDVLRAPATFLAGSIVLPELIRVIEIINATSFTVERGFAGTTAAAIAASTTIPAIGNAFPEASAKPRHRAIKPIRHLNNSHIFRNAWAQGRTLAAVKQIAGRGTIVENRDDATFFHGRDIELATFFSRKSNDIDVQTGDPIHTMDGIEALIHQSAPDNIKEAGATTSYDQLITMLDPLFDQRLEGTSGNMRTAYCGKGAINVLNAIGRLSGEYQIMQRESSYGLRFQEIILPRGTIRLVEHPIFNTNPDWQKMMIPMELSQFDFAYMEGRDTSVEFINKNKDSTDGTDADGGVITTELTIEMRNPFSSGIIYNLRGAAI
jgi:hypothetical protein